MHGRFERDDRRENKLHETIREVRCGGHTKMKITS